MSKEDRFALWVCGSTIFVCILCSMLTFWITRSHFEARAYNRLTGSDVTTWDAMFIECRVIGEAERDE